MYNGLKRFFINERSYLINMILFLDCNFIRFSFCERYILQISRLYTVRTNKEDTDLDQVFFLS